MKPNPERVVPEAKVSLRRRMHSGYQVAGYRLYGLDGVNKVASGEWFEAEDDQTAIEVAKTLMDGHDCELWQGRRLVGRIPHTRRT